MNAPIPKFLVAVVPLIVGVLSTAMPQTRPSPAWFEQAEAAAIGPNLAKARDLFKQAAAEDPDPIRRDRAAIRVANFEWHVFHDTRAARTWLDRVTDQSDERSAALSEQARMEIELTRDFAAARTAATSALQHARTLGEREAALIRRATSLLEPARQARLQGTCPADAGQIAAAVTDLRTAIDAGGPVLQTSRLLMTAGLMTSDAATVAQAWQWYYADASSAPPSGSGDRRTLAHALAAARFFPEADLVLRDACVSEKPAADAATRDLVAYASTLRRLDEIEQEHFRSIARGVNDDGAFQDQVTAESRTLWKSLSWPERPPDFSTPAFQREIERRFGAVMSMGRTDGILGLLFGHKVIDDKRTVEQYGHSAPLRFIALDGMVSSGYMAWVTHGQRGTGGWAGSDAMYQIRSMYADGPIRQWRQIAVGDVRARMDRDIADETRRDVERATSAAVTYFRGLDLRLRRQAQEALRARLVATGLSGDALRQAFVDAARHNDFGASIWAHEGRHAIDQLVFKISNSPELEFRAKLSEIAFAPAPQSALGSILQPVGPPGAHGIANERLLRGIVEWMRAHAGEIVGLDTGAALLPQLDKLNDDQLRAAARAQDPLAARSPSAPSSSR